VGFVLIAVCAVGVAFYLRFLIALCKEVFRTRICYLLRLEPDALKELNVEAERQETMLRRAA
jgi:hypothetical protein